jgi:hypothetical protein
MTLFQLRRLYSIKWEDACEWRCERNVAGDGRTIKNAGRAEENHERNLSEGSELPDVELKPGPPEGRVRLSVKFVMKCMSFVSVV